MHCVRTLLFLCNARWQYYYYYYYLRPNMAQNANFYRNFFFKSKSHHKPGYDNARYYAI